MQKTRQLFDQYLIGGIAVHITSDADGVPLYVEATWDEDKSIQLPADKLLRIAECVRQARAVSTKAYVPETLCPIHGYQIVARWGDVCPQCEKATP